MSNVNGLPNIPENDLNVRVNAIIEQIRRNKNTVYQAVKVNPISPYLFIMIYLGLLRISRDQLNLDVAGLFVEDEYADNETYADFLCVVHKSIQQKYT